ncbi:hypothetical protein Tco_1204093 [Tanacetum coccineum]
MQETALAVTPVLVVAPRSTEGTPPKRYKTKKDDTQNMDFKEEITTSASEGLPPRWIKETRTKIYATHKRTDHVLYIHFANDEHKSPKHLVKFQLLSMLRLQQAQQHGLVETSHVFAFREKNTTQMNWPQEKIGFEKVNEKEPQVKATGTDGKMHGSDVPLNNTWLGEATCIDSISKQKKKLEQAEVEGIYNTTLFQTSGDITIASIRKLIDEFTLSDVSSSTRWIKAVPIKGYIERSVKKAVLGLSRVDKSPGPDGFTFGFYRRYWTFLENDVVEAVFYFFNSLGNLLKYRMFQSAFGGEWRLLDGDPFILRSFFNGEDGKDSHYVMYLRRFYIFRWQRIDLDGISLLKDGQRGSHSFLGEKLEGTSLYKSDFPRMYALETQINISVALKLVKIMEGSFRLGISPYANLVLPVVSSKPLDKTVPIKVNIHAWKVSWTLTYSG